MGNKDKKKTGRRPGCGRVENIELLDTPFADEKGCSREVGREYPIHEAFAFDACAGYGAAV